MLPTLLLLVAFGSLSGSDLAMTMHCVGAGTCSEVNPLLRPLQDHPAAFGAVKAGLSIGAVAGILKVTKPRSWQRYAALAGLVVAQGIVVSYNARQLRQ